MSDSDNIYVNNFGYGKVGDTIVCEPALTALAEREQRKISFVVDFNNNHQELFTGHPWIEPIGETIRDRKSDYDANISDAFHTAHAKCIPFGAGFFHLYGLNYEGKRVHYKNYEIDKFSHESLSDHPCYNAIVIVPNGYSCTSRDSTTGQPKPNSRPNIQMPKEKWIELFKFFPKDRKVFSIAKDTAWDWLKFDDVPNLDTNSFIEILKILKAAALIISVETGILHMISAVNRPSIFLNAGTIPTFSKPAGPCKSVIAYKADEFRITDIVRSMDELLEMS